TYLFYALIRLFHGYLCDCIVTVPTKKVLLRTDVLSSQHRRLPPGSESGLHPPEQRHARADVRSHHDRRLTAADSLARQTPRVFPGRGGCRPHDRSRLSALRSAEHDPVDKIDNGCIIVERTHC